MNSTPPLPEPTQAPAPAAALVEAVEALAKLLAWLIPGLTGLADALRALFANLPSSPIPTAPAPLPPGPVPARRAARSAHPRPKRAHRTRSPKSVRRPIRRIARAFPAWHSALARPAQPIPATPPATTARAPPYVPLAASTHQRPRESRALFHDYFVTLSYL